jgi:hypothetical protein
LPGQRRLSSELDLSDRKTTGRIEQQAGIGQKSGATAEGCKPRKISAAVGSAGKANRTDPDRRQRVNRTAALAGALNIGLDTQDPFRIDLPVVADLTAAKPPINVLSDAYSKRGGRQDRGVGAAPTIAAVQPRIKPRPIVAGIDHRRRLDVGPRRQVSSHRVRCKQRHRRRHSNHNPIHQKLLSTNA